MSVGDLVVLGILDVSCEVKFLESTASSNTRESRFSETIFSFSSSSRLHQNRLVLNLVLSFPVLRVFDELVLMEALFQLNVNLTQINVSRKSSHIHEEKSYQAFLYNQDFFSHRPRQIEVS